MVQRLGDREGSTKLEAVKNGNETYTCREGRWNGNETQNVVGGIYRGIYKCRYRTNIGIVFILNVRIGGFINAGIGGYINVRIIIGGFINVGGDL